MKTYLSLFLAVALIAGGCSSNKKLAAPVALQKRIPAYSSLNDWAAHPWKWDPSDSIPKPLRNSIYRDSMVDVFLSTPLPSPIKKTAMRMEIWMTQS